MRGDQGTGGGRLAGALLTLCLTSSLAFSTVGCNGGEVTPGHDGGGGSTPTGTGGSGGTSGGSGGSGGGAGGGAGDAGVDAPPIFMPHQFIPGPYNRALVPGGAAQSSSRYKVIVTAGESPGGGNGVKTSSKYRFVGGLIGSTQR